MLIISGVFVAIAAVVIFKLSSKKSKLTKPGHTAVNNLHDEKQKSDLILNAIEDGVVLLDDKKTVQLFNPAAGVITGWDQKEAVGIDYASIFNLVDDKGEKYPKENCPFERAYSTKVTVRDQKANLSTRSNTTISLDITVSPLLNQQGDIKGLVGVFRDVSEDRKASQQRAEFVSTASHEMRTPVAAIEGYLALALNEKVSTIDSRAKSYLEKAHESTKHLGELFQDLLTSAKAEDGRLMNHPGVVEMGQLVESLTDGLKFSADKKGLGIEFVLGAPTQFIDASGGNVVKPLYYTYVDPDRIREVITNLFDNAVKYTETGKITIGLTGDDTVVQVRVTDTGAGIPSEDQPHLFEKFYRVDNSSTRTVGGTGLGLFICRKIVELYNGRIWVASEVGKGSTFYINLPRLSTSRAQELQRSEASKSTPLANTN